MYFFLLPIDVLLSQELKVALINTVKELMNIIPKKFRVNDNDSATENLNKHITYFLKQTYLEILELKSTIAKINALVKLNR